MWEHNFSSLLRLSTNALQLIHKSGGHRINDCEGCSVTSVRAMFLCRLTFLGNSILHDAEASTDTSRAMSWAIGESVGGQTAEAKPVQSFFPVLWNSMANTFANDCLKLRPVCGARIFVTQRMAGDVPDGVLAKSKDVCPLLDTLPEVRGG